MASSPSIDSQTTHSAELDTQVPSVTFHDPKRGILEWLARCHQEIEEAFYNASLYPVAITVLGVIPDLSASPRLRVGWFACSMEMKVGVQALLFG
jgi:hypothetical protein